MHRHTRTRLSLLVVLTLLLVSLVGAFTASTAVPRTGADTAQRTITPNDLRPVACATLDITALVTGSGAFTVGSTTLVLASGGADTIDILGSGNCVLAGGGSDTCYTSLLGSNVIIDCESVGPKSTATPTPSPAASYQHETELFTEGAVAPLLPLSPSPSPAAGRGSRSRLQIGS